MFGFVTAHGKSAVRDFRLPRSQYRILRAFLDCSHIQPRRDVAGDTLEFRPERKGVERELASLHPATKANGFKAAGTVPDTLKVTPRVAAALGFTSAEEMLRRLVCAIDPEIYNRNGPMNDRPNLFIRILQLIFASSARRVWRFRPLLAVGLHTTAGGPMLPNYLWPAAKWKMTGFTGPDRRCAFRRSTHEQGHLAKTLRFQTSEI